MKTQNSYTYIKTPMPAKKEFYKGFKAGSNGSKIYLILDESSSMTIQTQEVIDSVNSFIKQQKLNDINDADVSILKFNGSSCHWIRKDIPLEDVANISVEDYSPNGMTNLLDAVGTVIEDVDKTLQTKELEDRPGIVMLVITDGQENTSRSYTKSLIKELITDRLDKDWLVSYIGADVDAFGEAGGMGISQNSILSGSSDNFKGAFAAATSYVSTSRAAHSHNLTGGELHNTVSYSDEDRETAK